MSEIEPTPADHALAAALRSVDLESWPEMLAIYRLATEQATEQASDKLTVEWLRKFGCPDYFRVGVERGEHRKGT